MLRDTDMLALHAELAITPLEEIQDAVVFVDGARIAAVGMRGQIALPRGTQEVTLAEGTLVPGFVDLHIHGAGGKDVMDADAGSLETVAATVARFGTTSLVATTVTASPEKTCASVAGIASWMESTIRGCCCGRGCGAGRNSRRSFRGAVHQRGAARGAPAGMDRGAVHCATRSFSHGRAGRPGAS